MSSLGRAHDALDALWEVPSFYGPPDSGPAQDIGITREQWNRMIPLIIDTLDGVIGFPTQDRTRR